MTGKCPNCLYRVRLRQNGTLGRHRIYGMVTKPGDRYRVTREQQGRVYITNDSFYCEGTGKLPAETQAVADELYEAAKTYLERNKEPFEPFATVIYNYDPPLRLGPGHYALSPTDGSIKPLKLSIFERFNPFAFLRRLRHI